MKEVYLGFGVDLESDGDGILDADELSAGTDSCNQDTDGDGLSDPEEIALGTRGWALTLRGPIGGDGRSSGSLSAHNCGLGG